MRQGSRWRALRTIHSSSIIRTQPQNENELSEAG